MTTTIMTDVGVAMASALGAAKAITAISKAAPGVVLATHDFINGDYVQLSIVGMSELNNKVFRVCNVSTTVSFQLEDVANGSGISTIGFGTHVSGTAQKITFGTSITTASDIKNTGGDASYTDTSTIHSSQKTEEPTTTSAMRSEIVHQWDPSDPGQIAMAATAKSGVPTAFKYSYKSGKISVFLGVVSFANVPNGSSGAVVTAPASISYKSAPTYYGS
jgi:hypothetical protein